jgi:regulator of CtrA degradation
MSQPATINPRIIEALYCEALVLSDEVRAAFDLSARPPGDGPDDRPDGRDVEDLARVAFSCEALRTTTRMMHAVAWLLNHRAHFSGELSEFQLLRHGRLNSDYPEADAERLRFIDPETRALIGASERFYARLVRIDRGWRQRDPRTPSAIAKLRERLGITAAN